jgi:hypothetical protein
MEKCLCVIPSCGSAELDQEVIDAKELGKAFALRNNFIELEKGKVLPNAVDTIRGEITKRREKLFY